MTRTIFIIFLILLAAGIVRTQEITDEDRRGFSELAPINIDIDGDGELDAIQPRTYKTNASRAKGKKLKKTDIRHWIAFDLVTSKGVRITEFFRYNYGSDESAYWVYALKSAGDVDKDGKTDLVFYSGDDTSDETIILANRTNRFIVMRRKKETADDWTRKAAEKAEKTKRTAPRR